MPRTGQTLFTVTVLLLLAGCSALDFAQKVPEPEPKEEAESVSAEKPAECEWHEVRGVAELIAINNGDGTFMFYPGGHEVRAQVEEGWEAGDEFTAELRTADSDRCKTQIRLHRRIDALD